MCFSQAVSSKPQKQIQVDISRKEVYLKKILVATTICRRTGEPGLEIA